jgi:hypothetical protein
VPSMVGMMAMWAVMMDCDEAHKFMFVPSVNALYTQPSYSMSRALSGAFVSLRPLVASGVVSDT